jgi:hypothetical protein
MPGRPSTSKTIDHRDAPSRLPVTASLAGAPLPVAVNGIVDFVVCCLFKPDEAVPGPPAPGAEHSALSARFSAEVGDRGLVRSLGSCRVICRWTLRLTPLLIDAAPPYRHISGDRWYADEMSAKVAGQHVYPYQMIDQYGGHRPG